MTKDALQKFDQDHLTGKLILKIVIEIELRELLAVVSRDRKDYDGRGSRILKLKSCFQRTIADKDALAEEYLRRLTTARKKRKRNRARGKTGQG